MSQLLECRKLNSQNTEIEGYQIKETKQYPHNPRHSYISHSTETNILCKIHIHRWIEEIDTLQHASRSVSTATWGAWNPILTLSNRRRTTQPRCSLCNNPPVDMQRPTVQFCTSLIILSGGRQIILCDGHQITISGDRHLKLSGGRHLKLSGNHKAVFWPLLTTHIIISPLSTPEIIFGPFPWAKLLINTVFPVSTPGVLNLVSNANSVGYRAQISVNTRSSKVKPWERFRWHRWDILGYAVIFPARHSHGIVTVQAGCMPTVKRGLKGGGGVVFFLMHWEQQSNTVGKEGRPSSQTMHPPSENVTWPWC